MFETCKNNWPYSHFVFIQGERHFISIGVEVVASNISDQRFIYKKHDFINEYDCLINTGFENPYTCQNASTGYTSAFKPYPYSDQIFLRGASSACDLLGIEY